MEISQFQFNNVEVVGKDSCRFPDSRKDQEMEEAMDEQKLSSSPSHNKATFLRQFHTPERGSNKTSEAVRAASTTPISRPTGVRRCLGGSLTKCSPANGKSRIENLKMLMKSKSGHKSPFRDVLRRRCAERIREARAKIIDVKRAFNPDELMIMEEFENQLSSREVDENLKLLEEIELEQQLSQFEGYDEDLFGLDLCPVCRATWMEEKAADSGLPPTWKRVLCKDQACPTHFTIEGGLQEAVHEICMAYIEHSYCSMSECAEELCFGIGPDSCMVVICQSCDFMTSFGGMPDTNH